MVKFKCFLYLHRMHLEVDSKYYIYLTEAISYWIVDLVTNKFIVFDITVLSKSKRSLLLYQSLPPVITESSYNYWPKYLRFIEKCTERLKTKSLKVGLLEILALQSCLSISRGLVPGIPKISKSMGTKSLM